ncbi:hypothetical protein Vretimale_6436 [Volvox reticuliferus]|uniref:Uncharacterized protein n=1 Tax=Volvox reticuliferus TaxID=1737510 RepID=A0A8J4G7X5_9CHLO|nr:hypothetical protein Vretifemale_20012 [Volvox reticuliferus]GIM01703.1 hypothetical protein Vretimale_6436 [Volvox reticuliferus]
MESPTQMSSLRSLAEHPELPVASKAACALDVIENQLPEPLCNGLGPDMSFVESLRLLTSQRSAMPDKDPLLSYLDAAIIPLVEIQRWMYGGGPYDITSLKEANLYAEVSDLLGKRYLSEADNIGVQQEVEGILWGPARRPLVCLPVQLHSGKPINVFLLVDTVAPVTQLSPSVFNALGSDSIPSAAIVNLAGFRHTHVLLCDQGEHSNHKDIPILGADFLTENRCLLEVDYLLKTVRIRFQ